MDQMSPMPGEMGMDELSEEEQERLPQDEWNDELAENIIDFSDEEEMEKKGYIINAAQYLQPPSKVGGKRTKIHDRTTHIHHKPRMQPELEELDAYVNKTASVRRHAEFKKTFKNRH